MDIFALKAGNSKSYLAEFPDSTISTNSSHLYCVPMLCPVLFFLSRFPGLPLLQVIPDPFPLHSVILILGNHAGAVSQEENKNNEQDYHHRDQRSEEHTSELQSRFDLVCRLPIENTKIRRCIGASP